jgi:hypothetical protein
MIALPRSVRRLYPQVTTAIDAQAPIAVSVRQKDCSDAEKLDPTNCALARAAKREYKADGVIIGMSSSYIIRGTVATRYQTPEHVQREIVSFDRHGDFAPGEYYLPPKAPTAHFGVQSARTTDTRSNRGGGDHKPKRRHHESARVRVLPKGQGD